MHPCSRDLRQNLLDCSVKMHTLLDLHGYIPTFIRITDRVSAGSRCVLRDGSRLHRFRAPLLLAGQERPRVQYVLRPTVRLSALQRRPNFKLTHYLGLRYYFLVCCPQGRSPLAFNSVLSLRPCLLNLALRKNLTSAILLGFRVDLLPEPLQAVGTMIAPQRMLTGFQ